MRRGDGKWRREEGGKELRHKREEREGRFNRRYFFHGVPDAA